MNNLKLCWVVSIREMLRCHLQLGTNDENDEYRKITFFFFQWFAKWFKIKVFNIIWPFVVWIRNCLKIIRNVILFLIKNCFRVPITTDLGRLGCNFEQSFQQSCFPDFLKNNIKRWQILKSNNYSFTPWRVL
jgi:hypothetical protein